MSRRGSRFGSEVFNQFFLRENYPNNETFENAIAERLKYRYWDIGKSQKAQVKVIRNKHGARVVAYRSLVN